MYKPKQKYHEVLLLYFENEECSDELRMCVRYVAHSLISYVYQAK